MTRTRKFVVNSVATAIHQIALLLSGLVIPRVMLSYYGSEINGLVSSISQFIKYFGLVEAGLSAAATYALYRPLAEGNSRAISGIVAAARKLYMESGWLFVGLTFGLALFYPQLVRPSGLTMFGTVLLIVSLGIGGALDFFTLAKYRVLLTADQRVYVVSLGSAIHIILQTLIIAVLARRRLNVVLIYFVSLASLFVRSLILVLYVRFKYKFVDYEEKPNFVPLKKRWDALYLQILGAIHSGAAVIILTLLTRDLKLVSVYTIFNMVATGLQNLLGIFTSGLSPAFGDVIARGEQRILQRAYGEFEYAYYSLISIAYTVAFVMIMPFIRLYTSGVTDIDYDLPVVGFLFVLNGLLYNIKTPQGMLVISAGLFKETKAQVTIQGAIAVIVGAMLTPSLGIIGVLVGSILSNLYRDIDLIIFIPKHVTKLPVRMTVYRILNMAMCVGIILLPFRFVPVNPTSYVSWVVSAALVGLYAILIVLVVSLMFDRESLRGLVQRVKGMIM